MGDQTPDARVRTYADVMKDQQLAREKDNTLAVRAHALIFHSAAVPQCLPVSCSCLASCSSLECWQSFAQAMAWPAAATAALKHGRRTLGSQPSLLRVRMDAVVPGFAEHRRAEETGRGAGERCSGGVGQADEGVWRPAAGGAGACRQGRREAAQPLGPEQLSRVRCCPGPCVSVCHGP